MELSITVFNSTHVGTQPGEVAVLTMLLDSHRVLSGSETYMSPKSTFCRSVWKLLGARMKYPSQSLSQRLNSALLRLVNC